MIQSIPSEMTIYNDFDVVNGLLGRVQGVVRQARVRTRTKQEFLAYCSEKLTITFPDVFLRIYYEEDN